MTHDGTVIALAASDRFQAFSGTHWVLLGIFAIGLVLVPLWGRAHRGSDRDFRCLIFETFAGADKQQSARFDLALRRYAKQGSFAAFAFELLTFEYCGDVSARECVQIFQNIARRLLILEDDDGQSVYVRFAKISRNSLRFH